VSRRDEVIEERRLVLPVLGLVLDQAAVADGAAEIGEEENALQAYAPRREGLGGDPFLRGLVAVDVVDARVTRVAGLEALDLDVAVVDQVAAGHAAHGGETALQRVVGGIRAEAGRGQRQQQARQDHEHASHHTSCYRFT